MAGKDAARIAAEPHTPAFLAVYDLWVIKLSDRLPGRGHAGPVQPIHRPEAP